MSRRLRILAVLACFLCVCLVHLPTTSLVTAADAPKGDKVKPTEAGSGTNDGENDTEPAGASSNEGADDEDSEPSGGNGSLYDSLVAAATAGKPWAQIKIPTFSGPEVSQALANLIKHITTAPAIHKFAAKYKSLGLQLPQKLDLAGLMKTNNQTAEVWGKTINDTRTAVKDMNDYSLSLWNAVVAHATVATIETTAAKLEDMNNVTRKTYIENVQNYFIESTSLAWNNQSYSPVQQINLTETIGKFLDHKWLLELIEPVDKPTLDDPVVFTELALLKHVPADKIVSYPGGELGGSIANKYITTSREFLSKGNSAAASQLLMEAELVDYAEIAQRYCKPDHAIRFCLIKAIADQGALLAYLDRGLYNTKMITVLPTALTNLDRQKYLKALNKKVQDQTLMFQISKSFDDLQETVQKAAADFTLRTKTVTYESTKQQQNQLNTQMDKVISDMNSTHQGEYLNGVKTLKAKMDKMAALMTEVQAMTEPYLNRLKFIAEKALQQAESEKTRGIFGFIMKILACFNPVNWVTNPGVFSDVLRDGNKLRKTSNSVDNAKGLIEIIQNTLIPQFHQLVDKFNIVRPKLEAVANASAPIVNFKAGGSRDQLMEAGSAFVRAYADYESPVSLTDVDQLEEIFTNIQAEMCDMAKKRATNECSQVKTDVQVFDKLSQVFTAADEALDATAEIARGAVAVQSLQMMADGVQKASKKAADALEALKADWEKKAEEAQDKWTVYQRGLLYQQAVTGLGLIKASVSRTSATLMACNFFTYLNGGVATTDCLPLYANPASAIDLNAIIAYKPAKDPEPYEAVAYFPTSRSDAKDTFFLDLERMMTEGINVTIALPKDVKWLQKYNWVPNDFDIENTVVFVEKLEFLLPPKVLPKKDDASKQTVTVTASAFISDLGPAVNNKIYQIPLRQYRFSYEESGRLSEQCTAKFEYPYFKCDPQLLKACPISNGAVDAAFKDVPVPSLFSPFNIYSEFDSGTPGAMQQSYKGAKGSAPIPVNIKLQMYKLSKDQVRPTAVEAERSEDTEGSKSKKKNDEGGDDAEDDKQPEEEEEGGAPAAERQRQRYLRAMMGDAAKSKRCCAVGSYLKDWKTDECVKCPAGLVSQLGGLYCVRPPESSGDSDAAPAANNDEKTNSDEDQDDAPEDATERRSLRSILGSWLRLL